MTGVTGFSVSLERRSRRKKTITLIKRNYILYFFLLPVLIYIIIFNYVPLYGIQIAFKDFRPSEGILGSQWVGLYWFKTFIKSRRFVQILVNTLGISLYSLVVGFPVPIILALMINCLTGTKFKRIAQTVTYMPHFISIVVLVGMMSVFFSPRSGFINTLIGYLGGPPDTYFFGIPEYFRHLYVWSGIWQHAGWNSIIYIASLTAVSPELHESAIIDGASRLQRVFHIDIPTIIPTMVILLVLNCGSIMSVGFEKAYLMQNSLNLQVSEIIATYTYKIGLIQFEYSYSAAIGLFNNIINFVILISVNKLANKLSGSSLW
jgi:putative aldouronate transport system permease protein